MSSLDISFWNIHGHRSQNIGDKLNDPEFLDLLEGRDIVGIGELHAKEEVSIPGFVNKKQKIRAKNFNGPKVAGGIAVFVREEIDHLVKVVENKSEDTIWVKISNEKPDGENVYLGTFYVSPNSNEERSRKNYDFTSAIKLMWLISAKWV